MRAKMGPAAMYAVIQMSKLNWLKPVVSLCDTLARIATDRGISRIEELMPWAGQNVELPEGW
jgi:hypothetical protein